MSADELYGQFRLEKIQLINWGTFNGHFDIPVTRRGFLINGESGTGKSTLVDAMSTVLVPPGHVRFNAATQYEGRKKDGRNLIGYVRGAWKTIEDAQTGDIRDMFLRPRATYSVVGLTYRSIEEGGKERTYTLMAIYYVRAGVMRDDEIVKNFAVSPGAVDLRRLVAHLGHGVDKKGLKEELEEARWFTTYSPFAAYFRSLLGLYSEEAQLLLHRTQSAKSLGSLDQLFRDYMLPKPQTFDLADVAVEQFGDLREAYRRVDEVKQQIDVLEPLRAQFNARSAAVGKKDYASKLRENVTSVRDLRVHEALTAAIEITETALRDQKEALAQADAELARVRDTERRLYARMTATQTDDTARLQLAIDSIKEKLVTVGANRARAQGYCETLGTVELTDGASYREILAGVAAFLQDYPAELEAMVARGDELASTIRTLQEQGAGLHQDITSLASRRSNIARPMIELRTCMCEELGLSPSLLPFAGELIDIKREEANWEPVIQRLLRPLGSTLLVPENYRRDVIAWVNSHHIGQRLTLRSVPQDQVEPQKVSNRRSLSLKLQVVDHPMQQWLRSHIQDYWQYICVDSVEDLEDHRIRAVTMEGMVRYPEDRTRSRRYDKDDRFALEDRRQYCLGSSNDEKLELLRSELNEVTAEIQSLQRQRERSNAERSRLQNRQNAGTELQKLRWADIDVRSVEEQLSRLNEEYDEALSDPEHAQLRAQHECASEHLRQAEIARDGELTRRSSLEDALQKLHRDRDRITLTEDIDQDVRRAISERIDAKGRNRSAENISTYAEMVDKDLKTEIARAEQRIDAANGVISRILSEFLRRWPSELADLAADPAFAGEALALLDHLTSERLGEFRRKFLELMNDTATRNLSQINADIRRAKAAIDRRLEPINASLSKSQFAPGRFLAIETRERRGAEVIQFLADLNEAVSGGLNTTDEALALKRYHVLAKLLERLGSRESGDRRWRSAVLDTRRHVSFVGNEVSPEGETVSTHVNSASLSGGQAQKLVFFCLAAALRYRLADAGAQYPTYATVVLDEAFDRADAAFTRMAMDIFVAFGFHMILVTPGKQVQTLSRYVDGVAIVSLDTRDDKPQSLITNVTMTTDKDGGDEDA